MWLDASPGAHEATLHDYILGAGDSESIAPHGTQISNPDHLFQPVLSIVSIRKIGQGGKVQGIWFPDFGHQEPFGLSAHIYFRVKQFK